MIEFLSGLVGAAFTDWLDKKAFKSLPPDAPEPLRELRRKARDMLGYSLALITIAFLIALAVLFFSSRSWLFLLMFAVPGLLGIYYGVRALYLLLNERRILARA